MRALNGKRVLITRAADQADELRRLLEAQGAKVIVLPMIEIVPLPEGIQAFRTALNQIDQYDWLVLTSANTVTILDVVVRDWSAFKHLQVACIGTATAEQLRARNLTPALVPRRFQAESLAEALAERGIHDKRILLPRARGSREILPQLLEQAGASVTEIHLYTSEIPEESKQRVASTLADPPDYITFTSSSTVRHFVQLAGNMVDWKRTKAVSIGPITAGTLAEHGIPVAIQPDEYTIPALVHAIAEEASRVRRPGH